MVFGLEHCCEDVWALLSLYNHLVCLHPGIEDDFIVPSLGFSDVPEFMPTQEPKVMPIPFSGSESISVSEFKFKSTSMLESKSESMFLSQFLPEYKVQEVVSGVVFQPPGGFSLSDFATLQPRFATFSVTVHFKKFPGSLA